MTKLADWLYALAQFIITRRRTELRSGRRVTVYLTDGTTVRGILVQEYPDTIELSAVQVAPPGATKFRPLTRPLAVYTKSVLYMALEQ